MNNCKIIGSKDISLVCSSNYMDDINRVMFFDIVLNKDNNVIGNISFYFSTSNELEYGGNFTINIEPEYRNKSYGTTALKLFKAVIRGISYNGNKDIFISTVPYDMETEKIVKNNEGYLYFQGRVPEDDSLCYLNGIKLVKIYRIEI